MNSDITIKLQEFFRNTRVTAAELSRVSGISRSHISYLRRGNGNKCHPNTIGRLIEAMDILKGRWNSEQGT